MQPKIREHMSVKDLTEAKSSLLKVQQSIPWILSIVCALGMARVFGLFGLLFGLSLGLWLSYVALASTNAIIAILTHLSENDANGR
jgi:hypothetical protein